MKGCDDAGQSVSCLTATVVVTLAIAAGFFSLAPFLRLFEFSNGGENAVVASVQEMTRGGPWLVPTLHEELRTKKPPLTTWVSALATRPQTVAEYSSRDPATRREGFEDFGWDVRWPSLVAMCGVIAATYILGKQLGGIRLGVVSSVVCASSFFWLKNARLATTDAHLALWVAVGNCFLAWAVLARRWWPGLIGAGVSLGLAMMSKGPVALLQSVLPVLVFVAWQRWRVEPERSPVSSARGSFLWPLLTGVFLFAVVGLLWYVVVLWQRPEIWREWMTEVTREGATALEPSPWYNYVLLLGLMSPWTMLLVAGIIGAAAIAFKPSANDRDARRIVLALLLLLVPILIMSLFRDRKLRYVIPLIAPASILAGWGLLELLGPGAIRRRATPWLMAVFHWLPLIVVGIGLPIAGAFGWMGLTRLDGGPWYSLRFAIVAAEALLLVIVASLLLQRKAGAWAVLVGSAVFMVAWNVLLNVGYRHYREGRSEMRPLAEQILATHPDAALYSYRPDRPTARAPIDLSIYLNRVVDNVKTPEDMAHTTGPRLYLVRQREREAMADPSALAPPAGGPGGFFAATRVDNSTWYTFVSE
jgi:4-amino-4-deoxy-L-arabinose transferase-like glycosyltransferase